MIGSAVLDVAHGYAYLGTYTKPQARVEMVAVGTGDNPPTYLGSTQLGPNELDLSTA